LCTRGNFSIYGGYVSEKFHDRKTTMLDVNTPHGKNGVVGIRHITRDTEHKKEEPFVFMFLGIMLVFMAKHHSDHMKYSAWCR
jgi:hypothetical protein